MEKDRHSPEHPVAISELLITDNHSEEAQRNRNNFYDLMNNGQVYIVRRCSDARGNIPELNCIDVSSVATGGPQKPYGNMIIHNGIRAIVNLTHYDGTLFRSGKCPSGCGGLGAKEDQMINPPAEDVKKYGLARYIEALRSPDPLVQSYAVAESIAYHTDKNVLAAIQDHVHGLIFPIAVFMNRGITVHKKVPTRYLLQGQYDQRKIYEEEDIPTLDWNYLPPEFVDFLELNRRQVDNLEAQYPNLHDMLRVQNPEFVLITTEKLAARSRYPKTLQTPGSYFQVHIPRDKSDQVIHIDPRTIKTAVEQIEYPITHFTNAQTILIETGDLDQSRRIAKTLISKDWVRQWVLSSSNQILIAESRSAKTRRVEVFGG